MTSAPAATRGRTWLNEIGANFCVARLVRESAHEAGQIDMNCPHARHTVLEAIRSDLPLVPIDEDRIDGHQAELPPHAQRRQKICFAEADNRNVDRAADFQKTGLLKMANDECIVTRALCLQSIADRLRGATEFRQRMKEVIRRIQAMNLEAEIDPGYRVEQILQPLDVRCLLDGVNEALIPKPGWR